MDKCREAFEKQKHLTIYISNLVFDEKDNRYIPNEKRIRTFEEWEWKAFSNQAYAVNLAWWAWQSRQAELDQQKLLTLDSELHLDAAKEEIERLRGVVDKALNLINNWWHPNVDQKLFIEDVSKALRGHDQYAEHRTKAEEQINKGARLTKHQIDLGG
ncbi:hypothetical protein HUN33_00425 [Acinetobacter bereziniae]|uniref:hypothetical protein n=1 Tax=Acinetobacter bereziniae TaxID=106648 RepID=UPI0015802AE8|nr:hypothetical protein [Acinetobacter bereziniae]NUF61554.1 hypothetical protein [Acinetobacter bereziniae]NUG06160.1 hypothetical protein [Acinetobacter bereziniae]NUG62315.1 hypothetical protein [Acinetobacter bereziniae]NUG69183.1 hypothetical protein [Acinetobacter bereziniae]NUG78523.1 hypothetical protein [Acinetobacter bereziniae]